MALVRVKGSGFRFWGFRVSFGVWALGLVFGLLGLEFRAEGCKEGF